MKRDSLSVYVHMKRDTLLPLYASGNILDAPSIPLVTNILNGWPFFHPKDK